MTSFSFEYIVRRVVWIAGHAQRSKDRTVDSDKQNDTFGDLGLDHFTIECLRKTWMEARREQTREQIEIERQVRRNFWCARLSSRGSLLTGKGFSRTDRPLRVLRRPVITGKIAAFRHRSQCQDPGRDCGQRVSCCRQFVLIDELLRFRANKMCASVEQQYPT